MPASPASPRQPAALASPRREPRVVPASTVPRAAVAAASSPSSTAAAAGDIAGLVRELQQLAARGSPDALGGFLRANPNSEVLNGSAPPHSRTALIIAAAHRKVPNMGLLLRAGADTERADIHGWTAFHYACSSGDLAATEVLLRAGCDVSKQEKNGRTGAALAMEQGMEEIVSVVENHTTAAQRRPEVAAVASPGSGSSGSPGRAAAGSALQAELAERRRRLDEAQARREPQQASPQQPSPQRPRQPYQEPFSPVRGSTDSLRSLPEPVRSASAMDNMRSSSAMDIRPRMALQRELQRERERRTEAEGRAKDLEGQLERAQSATRQLEQTIEELRTELKAARPSTAPTPAAAPSSRSSDAGGSGAEMRRSSSRDGGFSILGLLQNTIRAQSGEAPVDPVNRSYDSLHQSFTSATQPAPAQAVQAADLATVDALPSAPLLETVEEPEQRSTPRKSLPRQRRGADAALSAQSAEPQEEPQQLEAELTPESESDEEPEPEEQPEAARVRKHRPTVENIDFNMSDFDGQTLSTDEDEDEEDSPRTRRARAAEKEGQEEEAAVKRLSADAETLASEVQSARAAAAASGIAVAKVGSCRTPRPPAEAAADEAVSTPSRAEQAEVQGDEGEEEDHTALMEAQVQLSNMSPDAFNRMMDLSGHDPTLRQVQQAIHELVSSDPERFLADESSETASDRGGD